MGTKLISDLTAKTGIALDDLFMLEQAAGPYRKTVWEDVITTKSRYVVSGFGGFGSTNTNLPYFTITRENTDPYGDFTILNDSTNGLEVTINNPGKVVANFSFNTPAPPSGMVDLAISRDLNTIQKSLPPFAGADIRPQANASIEAISSMSGNLGANLHLPIYTVGGITISPHTTSATPADPGICYFHIMRAS